jgi:hypothetical protein
LDSLSWHDPAAAASGIMKKMAPVQPAHGKMAGMATLLAETYFFRSSRISPPCAARI